MAVGGWRTRLLQAGIVALGLVVGAAMILLGIWQGRVYSEQGDDAAAARAAEPAVRLADVAPPAQRVGDGFGRTVTFSGEYDPASQLLVPLGDGRHRVLTALVQPDGSLVPVVRGVVTGTQAPAPPAGTVQQQGVLAPSEASSDPASLPPDQISAVQLSVLAQRWSGRMIGGYVTLDAAGATAHGLEPATAQLPEQSGRARNAAYALQWWLFAAFAVGMAIKMAVDLGRRDLVEVADPDPARDQAADEVGPARADAEGR